MSVCWLDFSFSPWGGSVSPEKTPFLPCSLEWLYLISRIPGVRHGRETGDPTIPHLIVLFSSLCLPRLLSLLFSFCRCLPFVLFWGAGRSAWRHAHPVSVFQSVPVSYPVRPLAHCPGPSSPKPLRASLKYISSLLICHPSQGTFGL